MTTKKNYLLLATIAVICVCSSGCARTSKVRQFALQLRASVIEDEILVDKNIEAQRKFYNDQRGLIEEARTKNIQFNVDAFRRERSAQVATTMSVDPNSEARLANLMDYLHETDDQEFKLWKQLYGDDQQAREDLKSKIAKLERQKKLLEQVKDNLNQLALAPSSKKRAQALITFSQETYAAFKKTSQ